MRLGLVSVICVLLLGVHMSYGATVWIGLSGVNNATCSTQGQMCKTLKYALKVLPPNDDLVYIRFTGEYFSGPGYCNLTIPASVDHISGDMDLQDSNTTVIDCLTASRHWFVADADDSGRLIVDFIDFVNGAASGHGGAINSRGRNLDVSFSNFVNCSSTIDGGAVAVGRNHTLNIVQSFFDSCMAGNNGGAVSAPTVVITGSNFTNCEALGNGGAAFAGITKIKDSNFIENSAGNSGGAIAANYSLWLDNAVVGLNTARASGGGIYLLADPSTVNKIVNSEINDNVAELLGGGIYVDAASLEFNAVYVFENTALNFGGGILIQVDQLASFVLKSLWVWGNQAQGSGAGIKALSSNGYNGPFAWFDNANQSNVFNNTDTLANSAGMLANIACDTSLCVADCSLSNSKNCDDCAGLCVLGNDGAQCLGTSKINCGSHGSCMWQQDYQVCKCSDSYSGDACDAAPKDDKKKHNNAVGIALGVIFGVLGAVVIAFFVRRYLLSRKDKEYEPILPTRK